MSIWEKIKFFASDIWKFLQPFVMLFLKQSGQALAMSAMAMVSEVAISHADADGAVKREVAFDRIVEDLKGQGVSLGTSVINSAIEVALQKLKAS